MKTRYKVPLKQLKLGYRHVFSNIDGYFWKDRWVVCEINENGVISYLERYNHDTKECKIDEICFKVNACWNHDPDWVYLDITENPSFDPQESVV